MLSGGDRFQRKRRMARRWRGNDDRIDMRQDILDVGVCGDVMLKLLTAVTDLREPLVDANDSCHPGRGTKHADVPRTPIAHSDDADPYSPRARLHVSPPLTLVLRSRAPPFPEPRPSPPRTAPPRERPNLRQVGMIGCYLVLPDHYRLAHPSGFTRASRASPA